MWEIEAEAETRKPLTVVKDEVGERGGLRRRLGIIAMFHGFRESIGKNNCTSETWGPSI